MTKSDILKNIPDAGGISKNWASILTSLGQENNCKGFYLPSEIQTPQQEPKQSNKKDILLYAGIAIVIGIIAFIIIKKHKK